MPLYTVTVDAQALTAATVKTMWQVVAPASRTIRIVEWGVSFDGVAAASEPVKVEIVRQGSAGTSSAGTINKVDETSVAATATSLVSFTGEPTLGSVLFQNRVTPNGGLLVMQYPFGREIVVGTSNRLGLRITADDAVNATSYVVFEE
jgi:hypothetical protein